MNSTWPPKCSGVILQAPLQAYHSNIHGPIKMVHCAFHSPEFTGNQIGKKKKANFQTHASGTSDHIMANGFIVKHFLSLGSLSERLFVLLSILQTQQLDTSGIMLFSFCMEKKRKKQKEKKKKGKNERRGEYCRVQLMFQKGSLGYEFYSNAQNCTTIIVAPKKLQAPC